MTGKGQTFFTHVAALAIGFLAFAVTGLVGLVEESKHMSYIPEVYKKSPLPNFAPHLDRPAGIGLMFMPPEIYQRDTRAVIQTVRPDEISLYCDNTEAAACKTERAGHPIIVMPNPCEYVTMPYGQRDPYAAILCHELGHVNGWDHGDIDQQGIDTLDCRRWPVAWDSLNECTDAHSDAERLGPELCRREPPTAKGRRVCAIYERFYQ